mgnify:CR=1 FL=1
MLEAQQLRAKLQQDLAGKEAELTRKILGKMKPLIAKIARKGGYTVILDAGQVLHAPDDLDVTDKLIRLYDKENRGKLIKEVKNLNSNIFKLADTKITSYGSGGMITKLEAASICMNAGCHMFIGNGNRKNPIKYMVEKKIFTKFIPKISTLAARKKWIVSSLSSHGTIFIDKGASNALKNGKSLLAAGIRSISGKFDKGENILIADLDNNKLARGLASFSSSEIGKIKGRQSNEIERILGYSSKTEVVHKDDMVKL